MVHLNGTPHQFPMAILGPRRISEVISVMGHCQTPEFHPQLGMKALMLNPPQSFSHLPLFLRKEVPHLRSWDLEVVKSMEQMVAGVGIL
jgi:hypothetical protein